MKVRFKRDVTTKEAKPQSFKAGDEVDFYELFGAGGPTGGMTDDDFERNRRARAEAAANHWVHRGAAERVEEDDGKARKGVKPAPAKADDKPADAKAPAAPANAPKK